MTLSLVLPLSSRTLPIISRDQAIGANYYGEQIMMNLNSIDDNDTGSEIPEWTFDPEEGEVLASSTDDSEDEHLAEETAHVEKVVECLREGGESLSVSDISEHTDLTEREVRRALRYLMTDGTMETREVFEDENVFGAYFWAEPLLDRLAI